MRQNRDKIVVFKKNYSRKYVIFIDKMLIFVD